MKAVTILTLLTSHAFAAQPVLPRVTAQTLAGLQARDPMVRLVKPSGADTKVARPNSPSIIKQSTILADGTNWTLIPKGAVIFLPESMKAKVNGPRTGNLISWLEFLGKNRSWITTSEVTIKQATGNEVLSPELTEHWAKQRQIVIAVHQQGPISVSIAEPNTQLTEK